MAGGFSVSGDYLSRLQIPPVCSNKPVWAFRWGQVWVTPVGNGLGHLIPSGTPQSCPGWFFCGSGTGILLPIPTSLYLLTLSL